MSRQAIARIGLSIAILGFTAAACRPSPPPAEHLARDFASPPPSSRPWVYWFWLNGNITREGITADLEAMKTAGIGGVLIMEVDQGAPQGPVAFGGPEWRKLFAFVCSEADRLGLEVNMNNDAGWCGSGGPWVKPEHAAQKVVWTETAARGPQRFEGALPAPPKIADYYRDIRVLAFPSLPAGAARIDGIRYKAMEASTDFHYAGRSSLLPSRAVWPEPPAGETIPRNRIVDLTDRMDEAGRLVWDVPEGDWTILRLGSTPTGIVNAPAPASGTGLDCDKMSLEAIKAHFDGFLGPLADAVGGLTGKSFVSVHIDSWETNTQNWTGDFAQEFQRRRGYDLRPFLPVLTGRFVDGREVSERFLWDFRQTISELVPDRYAAGLRDLAARRGLRLSIEAYTTCPTDELAYAGRADEPMGEFWPIWFFSGKPYGFGFTCTEMASAGHVYGKKIIGAEAFTSTDGERWLLHPALVKEIGDWAFAEGINRFVFHRYAMQPWIGVRPGMAMGPWGLHYERTQSWWGLSGAWHEYLARCQHLLRQGLFVADVCYLTPEGAPFSIGAQQRLFSGAPDNRDEPRERTGYNYDLCPPEALLTRMSVKDGRLVLPDGMSYRLLVLPQSATMTPPLLRKIKALLEAGATVVGPRPVRSPGLAGYPECDWEVRKLAGEIWGTGEPPAVLTSRSVGKGRLYWSAAIQAKAVATATPGEALGQARWIWHPEGNPAVVVPPGVRAFRKVFSLEEGKTIASARLLMHAEDAFTAWLNGRKAGEGHNFHRNENAEITAFLKQGENTLIVEAVNRGEKPSPAGLIGRIAIRFTDGTSQDIFTDGAWASTAAGLEAGKSAPPAQTRWAAAKDVGPMGMPPWGEWTPTYNEADVIPGDEIAAAVMKDLDVPPDFAHQAALGPSALRTTHRSAPEAEIYFVANKLPRPEQAVLSFRTAGKRPEIWHPDSGRIERPAVYDEVGGIPRLPVSFEPSGSVFVVFREKAGKPGQRLKAVARDGREIFSTARISVTGQAPGPMHSAWDPGLGLSFDPGGRVEILSDKGGRFELTRGDGRTETVDVPAAAPRREIEGAWTVRFAPGGGAPESAVFEKLMSWSDHPDKSIAFFSGEAAYVKSFDLAADELAKPRRLTLDLGDVQVMAAVKLNGKDLGILWKPPYRVDITEAAKPGRNELKIRVANLPINRQIGDEFLPEDSGRNPDGTLKAWPRWLLEGKPSPTGRFTFSSWRLWKKGEALQPSGLLGPVVVTAASVFKIGR